MKKKFLTLFMLICVSIGLFGTMPVSAYIYGDYLYYTVSDGEITISDCDISATTIEIPSSINGYPVTGIGERAFRYCDNLTSISIPDSVTSIGGSAFDDCDSLTSITIPDSVTSIGDAAFYDCDSLTSVTIGNSVTSIGYSAFYDCGKLTSITIPNGVTYIDARAFMGCGNLTSITIPNGVTYIGSSAFMGCSSLTSITIPDSIKTIGSSAFSGTGFYNNNSNWDNGVLYIGNHLIKAKSSLSGEYTVKSGTIYIACNAFYGCGSLISINIPAGVTSIDYSVFYDCDSLTSVTIPSGVTSIGGSAFDGCGSLTNITIPDSVTSIGEKAFYNCTGLASIKIPSGVTNIGNSTFYGCSSLNSITIPDSITTIGSSAFSGTGFYKNNSNWDNSVLYIDNHLIAAKTSLSGKYIVKSGTICIADRAFYNCTGLTSVMIPDSVTSIGEYAFYYCKGLSSITIGNGVMSIGEYAFSDCTALWCVNITDVAAWCNIDFESHRSNPLYYAYLHLNGELITDLVIPGGVTSIGDWAFYNCSSLTSVSIPDGMTSIGDSAFYNCSSLTSVTIPDSVTSIGDAAFYSCWNLTSVNITDISAWCNIDFGNYSGNPLYYAKKLYLNDKLISDLVIPNGVTAIKSYAFYDYGSLKSVTIPDSVMSIGNEAFRSCGNLKSITIPAGVTNIGSKAFCNCNSLTNVAVGDGVTSIGDEAFYYCTGLTSVTIGNGVTCIGDGVFYDCTGLTQINWNAKKIIDLTSSSNIFYNAGTDGEGINAVFGDNTEYIPAYLFYANSSSYQPKITSVTIGNGVTNIGNSAFYGCSSLADVYYTGTEDEWNNISISNGNNYLTKAARTYITEIKKGTNTSVSGKTFTVTPINVSSGNTVIIALYNGEKLVDTQSKTYAGESLEFTTEKDYTSAKVFVWESVTAATPICAAEVVK